MPTRSYYFPKDFTHLEAILLAELEPPSEGELQLFRDKNIPPILDEGTLAILLGIGPKLLWSIRSKTQNHYRSFSIQKSDGTVRNIDSPRTYLKVIQWWINDNILAQVKFPEFVFGFVPGRNIVQNAEFHFGSRHILNVDIKDFFPSISEEVVQLQFQRLGYSERVSVVLASLCCFCRRLPQGAPTSPAIANIVLTELDDLLQRLSCEHTIKYSRYADDLTFSSNKKIEHGFLMSIAAKIEQAGFEIKEEKTRFAGRGNRMEVTGVVINEIVQPSRKWRKHCRARIHRISQKSRLTRKELAQLYGIKGACCQFLNSNSLIALTEAVNSVIEAKRETVIGIGQNVYVPKGLTKREIDVLLRLRPRIKNREIAVSLGVSESTVKKRFTSTFQKIGVTNRNAALRWATENI